MATCLAVSLTLVGCGGRGYSTALVERSPSRSTASPSSRATSLHAIAVWPGQGSCGPDRRGPVHCQDVPQGKVRVDFYATEETGRTVAAFDKSLPETVNIIPDKYRAGMEIEVGPDKNNRDFNL